MNTDSINGFGTTFCGQRAFRKDGSFITTKWFTIAYIPLWPLKSLRVIKLESREMDVLFGTGRYTDYKVLQTLPRCRIQVCCTYGYVALMASLFCLLAMADFTGKSEGWLWGIAVLIVGAMFLPWCLRAIAKSSMRSSDEDAPSGTKESRFTVGPNGETKDKFRTP